MITRDKRQTGKRDECVPAPAAKPWETGSDLRTASFFYDELVSGIDQAVLEITSAGCVFSAPGHRPA